jgi:hypothetical protein
MSCAYILEHPVDDPDDDDEDDDFDEDDEGDDEDSNEEEVETWQVSTVVSVPLKAASCLTSPAQPA